MSLYQVSETRLFWNLHRTKRHRTSPANAWQIAWNDTRAKVPPFNIVKDKIEAEYQALQSSKVRGIESVKLSFLDTDTYYQAHHSIFLSYRLNGTFASYTEYEPAAERKEDQP